MTIEEARASIMDLRGRFASPYNQTDKGLIERLYWAALGRVFRPTSCQNCYHDAVIEIYSYLKKHDTMAEERKYLLKAGAIINTPAFDEGKIYSNANLTDDVASRYLEQFPNQVVLFQKLPEPEAEPEAAPVAEAKPETKKAKKSGAKNAKAKEAK